MSLAQEYRALAQGVRDELPEDIKAHIKDNLRNAAQRGKFETLYIVPEKWSNNVEAMKVFFSKNPFAFSVFLLWFCWLKSKTPRLQPKSIQIRPQS